MTLTTPSPSRSAQSPAWRRRDLFGASAEAIAAKTRAKTALIPTEKTELNVPTRLAFAPEKGGGGNLCRGGVGMVADQREDK